GEKLRLLRADERRPWNGERMRARRKNISEILAEAPEIPRGGVSKTDGSAIPLYHLSDLIFVADRAGASNVFLDRLRITRIRNFARAGDCHFQYLANGKLGISCAGGGDFGGFGLKTIRG